MTRSAEFGFAPRNVVIDLEVRHRARASDGASRCPYMHVRAVRALQGGIIGEARIVERAFGVGPCVVTEATEWLQDHLARVEA